MKKHAFISLALLCVLFITPAPILSLKYDNPVHMATAYIGASTTGKFHYPSCRWANRIRSDHRVYFDSRDDAISAGYVPCKVCSP